MSKVFTITAGHGGDPKGKFDPGAVGNGKRECDVAVEMRNMVAYYLKQSGATVKTDGSGTINQRLVDALKLIPGSQVSIEFHCNAGVPSAKGVELLAQPKDKILVQKLAKVVAPILKTSIRGESGWKSEDSGQHSRLAYVSAGGIIFELFFITNAAELAEYEKSKWQIAKAISQVLLN